MDVSVDLRVDGNAGRTCGDMRDKVEPCLNERDMRNKIEPCLNKIRPYFHLQYIMTNRKLRDLGFTPAIAYVLIAVLFLIISFSLFHKIDYAQYIYLTFPLPFFSRLANRQRNDFLKVTFLECQYKIIRLTENLLVALPFALFLCWKQCFLAIIPLITISILYSMLKIKNFQPFVLPTPFSKHPFEFSVGFRNTFYLFPVAYYLTAMAVLHDNFNLGMIALGLVFIITCSFYFRADANYYVWIFNLSPSRFLRYKIKKAFLYTFLLCLPILLILNIFYWTNGWILLLVFLLGCLLLMTVIFAKYASFPDDIGIGETLLLVISIVFFPLLFIMLFYFRNKAIEKLNSVLA